MPAAAALVCAIAGFAQTVEMDNPKLGRVTGRVIDSKSGDPIRKALVMLRRDPNPSTGTQTDASGAFSFRDIEPGAYTVAVEKDGWVPARESKTVTTAVTEGNTTPPILLKLVRTATVSGRVVDADGDPLAGVSVQVSPEPPRKSGPPGPWASTNDRGEYRAYNVAPGQYRVCATYSSRQGMDMRMQQPLSTDGKPAPPVAFPKVCYPGSTQGAVVTVESAMEMQGIDLQILPARAVRVRGRVISHVAEKPAFAMVMLQNADGAPMAGVPPEEILRDADGKFELHGVLPGRYRLTVAGASLGGETKYGSSKTIEVGETDLDGVEIVVGSPRKIDGKVIVPEGRKVPPLMVVLASREPGDHQGGGISQVSSNGTFSFADVGAGEYDVILGTTGPGDDLYVSAIRLGDSDALADGVRSDIPGSLEIVLRPNGGTLKCSVTDDDGKPVPATNILLVPDPPREHQIALAGNCRTDAEGACSILGITPGDYHAYAFPQSMEIDQRDPTALKPFEKYGKAVTFSEGERRDLPLKAAPVE